MMRIRIHLLLGAWLVWAGGQAATRAQTNGGDAQAPDFKEVYDLIRAHLVGTSEGQLNQTAVEALVAGLAPRVALVTNAAAAGAAAETPLVLKSSVFEGNLLYVRVGRVGEGLADAVRAACRKPGTTNKLAGLALDLRYADGDDYTAAAATAGLFVKQEQPLLNWGSGMVRSPAQNDVISLPVAVLVNRQTAGAAEALAAVLRETGTGLILGRRTAGQAMVAKEFPLKNGEKLRIATAPIQLGDGTAMSERGLKPDITVEVNPADERAYYADAFKATGQSNLLASAAGPTNGPGNGTNRVSRRPRFNEAELVRERREGVSEADVTALRAPESEPATIQDPTLARALDLLRGLALVRQSRP